MHKKSHSEQVIPGKGFAPSDRVREMAARGFAEPEMIDILRREGFSADEVDKALTQALKIGVTGEQPQKPPTQQFQQQPQQKQQWQPAYQQQQQPQQQNLWPSEQKLPDIQPKKEEGGLPTMDTISATQQQGQQASMPQIPETSLPEGYYSQYSNEEYVDYLVQQRMAEVTEKVGDFQKRYQDLQKKIEDLNGQLKNASQAHNPAQSQMNTKMETFTDSMEDIDSRLNGLEKAFKETLPELIESVRTLGDIVQKFRKEKEQQGKQ